MKVFRMTEYDTEEFMVGDQIYCGFGLATCQKVSDEGGTEIFIHSFCVKMWGSNLSPKEISKIRREKA